MIQTLNRFTTGSLFDATSHLLNKLNIKFDRETAEPINIADLYDGTMPQYLLDALQLIDYTYFIGVANDQSLTGGKSETSISEIEQKIEHGGKYDGMFIFACDARTNVTIPRSALSALTRAFNRLAKANPVILFVRQGSHLSLATCERLEYSQTWRQNAGEKLGKVSILRDIECCNDEQHHTHPGHIQILDALCDKPYHTFEELYKHWMEVFSSELLTKKFYNELSDWYAWAVQIVKFPNDLRTEEDDAKYNHEACIRLITRLIFVWFLKQKHLIPEEFFDEKYIRENLIENFNPHDKNNLLYDTEKSKYYRLILQNLFFAMLNCPIVAEGKTTANNRRFRAKVEEGQMNKEYNINNLMRYEQEFCEGGAQKFLKIANNSVPFLNGGLFDCLDVKPNYYYDGFSERKASLDQLYFPDFLFFGDEVGKGIDLSQWYDDVKKKNVSARGIIDILKRYSFTIEENTPYDQEVSLDPELLGKVFENLLAAVNPDTRVSARKQTGSFYTPREVVRYMVDESLVAYLKRVCGGELESQFRALLSYADENVKLTTEQRKSIMRAIYDCKVLDPACGSGAFPMGVLQQMVRVLKGVDDSNKMWEELVLEESVKATQIAFEENLKRNKLELTPERKKENDRLLQERTDDIERSFNTRINDPDYARKLYLIERCIYGVDIQPIATQISKLRFFISLVVDQKPTKEPQSNFGIRPLPNLESKFVTADTLVPLDRKKNLFTSTEEIREYEDELKEINHRLFLAKKNKDKQALRERMVLTRQMMAQSMENLGVIGSDGYNQIMGWEMFDQNSSAGFFDPEWMFGTNNGFDIYIGNPPYNGISENNGVYIRTLIEDYKREPGTKNPLKERKLWLQDDYVKFIRAIEKLIEKNNHGILAFINNSSFIDNPTFRGMRWHLLQSFDTITIIDLHGNARKNNTDVSKSKDENIFNIMQGVSINIFEKGYTKNTTSQLATIYHSEIQGLRSKKLDFLGKATRKEFNFKIVEPVFPFILFSPQSRTGIDEYDKGFSIVELMKECATGVTTARDGLVIDISKEELLQKIKLFADTNKSNDEIRQHFFGNKKSPKYPPGDSRGWKLSQARQKILSHNLEQTIIPMAFRVLDNRYIYYSSDMVDWGRENVYCHVINHDNFCLAVPRQTSKEWKHVFVSNKVANFNFLATGGQNGAGTHFPLYLYKNGLKVANINKDIWDKINDLSNRQCSPENIFDYVYGILHSPHYRLCYNEFLRGDFPKIPYPKNSSDFDKYMTTGNALRTLHLFENLPRNMEYAIFEGDGDCVVNNPTYKEEKVFINKNQYFSNIPKCIWEMQIGDDLPARRWLKERRGRHLSQEDITFYQQIAYILFETKHIMDSIE